MAKVIGLLSVLILLIASCGQPKDFWKQVESFEDGSKKREVKYSVTGADSVVVNERIYYENGNPKLEGLTDGKKQGLWKYWYENGNLWSECEYKDNIKVGWSRVYFGNGQMRYEGKYENDVKKGVWKFWNEAGKLVTTREY